MEKDERLMEASWWERLTEGENGSCSYGWGHAQKSLIWFSIDGWSCVPSLLFTYYQTMVEVMKIMGTSFKRSWACTATLSILQQDTTQSCSRPPPMHPSAGDSWPLTASLGQSPVGSLLLSAGSWCTQGSVCALQKVTTNCRTFLKRWEYHTTSPASWEICMQVRKQ